MSFGLYDDGWTKPHVTVRVRVFPEPGQRGAVTRFVTFQVQTPLQIAKRPFTVSSNLETRHEDATNAHTTFVPSVLVCVPPRGFAEVTLETPDSSTIPGDQSDEDSYEDPDRQGGLLLNEIALAGETGPACRIR
jgi:hypothetical protein